ncbi:hypothetical protein AWB67_07551 [Caballeronia terrestris]|uniref:Uncharacterized protein n=1 Tax=Caballeronia terrestris TaxID=1226301 RepID=A0A158L482_9BURK|nr:hypothetical protein AWB67_07551 [Caballeronia terrestris]
MQCRHALTIGVEWEFRDAWSGSLEAAFVEPPIGRHAPQSEFGGVASDGVVIAAVNVVAKRYSFDQLPHSGLAHIDRRCGKPLASHENFLSTHVVQSERARFVGADPANRTERLDCREAAHQGVSTGHVART